MEEPYMPVIFYERKCPVCGKDFIFYSRDMYVYRTFKGGKEQLFCSWTCLNKFRNKLATDRAERLRKRREEKKKNEK